MRAMYRVARGSALLVVAGVASSPTLARAQQTVPTTPVEQAATPDPDSPLMTLPDIGVDWPDLATAPGADDAAKTERTEIAADISYSYAVKGLEDARNDLLRQRFDDLSSLKAHDRSSANAAQLDRRAREDADLLTALLKAQGYYDARVDTDVSVDGGKALVTLTATSGAIYRFDRVTLAGVDKAGDKSADLTKAFGVALGDPVNSDAIAGGVAAVTTTIGKEGFPFAHVGQPQIVVDHATQTATLDLSVAPNGQKTFGKIIASTGKVFDAHHIQEIARFKPGEPYDATQLADLDRALIQTSLVSSVTAKPVPQSQPA